VGSLVSREGMGTLCMPSASAIFPVLMCSLTARFSSSCARFMKRRRLPILLSLGLSRRSMKFGMNPLSGASGLARLVDPHVPVYQSPNLPLRIPPSNHALDELAVLLFGRGVLLGTEADHWEQIFNLTEHPLLDDFTHLLVARPGRIVSVVPGACPERELHHFVAEVLRVRDACRLFDLRELAVEDFAIEDLPRIRILVVLVLQPRIR